VWRLLSWNVNGLRALRKDHLAGVHPRHPLSLRGPRARGGSGRGEGAEESGEGGEGGRGREGGKLGVTPEAAAEAHGAPGAARRGKQADAILPARDQSSRPSTTTEKPPKLSLRWQCVGLRCDVCRQQAADSLWVLSSATEASPKSGPLSHAPAQKKDCEAPAAVPCSRTLPFAPGNVPRASWATRAQPS